MKANIGIKRIVEQSRRLFRRPENLLHYEEKDYQEAERKFVKFMLESGGVRQGKRFSDFSQRSLERREMRIRHGQRYQND
jgi:hypothetical protein